MLVLTRSAGESLRIGNGICITVMRVQGNRVKIGVEASAKHRILRGELRKAPLEHPQEVASASDTRG